MAPRAPPWRARRDLSGAILAIFAVALCLLVVLPIGWLVVFAFTGRGGGFTLANFRLLFSDAPFLDPLLTTLTLAVPVSLSCGLVAAPMGWIVARSDMPLRRTVRFVVMASFVTPPFLGAIAWELLAAPNSGLLNQLRRASTGAGPDAVLFNVYTLPGLVLVISCYTFPYVFVLVANALDRIPGELEDASSMLGGSAWRTARRVTIPLALPALAAGALIAFLQAMTLFGAPGILALPAGFHTMTTKIWSLFQYPPKPELAAAQLALKTPFLLGLLAATPGTPLALVISSLPARAAIRGHRLLGFLATAPIAIPAIALGVGLFLAYTRGPVVLYGTLWILLLAYVTIELPAAYQQLQASFRSLAPELEEASRILGASRLRTLRDITAPLLGPSLVATWCFVFVAVVRLPSAPVILFPSETKVLSVLIFDLKESGDLAAIAVLGLPI